MTTWQPSPTLRPGPGSASARCHACSTGATRCARRRVPRSTRRWRSWATARLAHLLAAGRGVRGSSACSCRTSTSRPRTSACAASSGRCSRTASRSCCTTSTRPIAPAAAWWNFHGHQLDGLIIISLPLRSDEGDRLAQAPFPIVLVDTAHPALPSVVIDDRNGGRIATEYLLSLGHERIAFIGEPERNPFGFVSSRQPRGGLRRRPRRRRRRRSSGGT